MLLLKGFIIGIGKIIPGVSGSLLAISLGVYEKALSSLINFFSDMIKNIYYLGTLCLGILIAIIFGSNIILYFINNYYLYTMFLFIGLMMGNFPNNFNKVKITKKINYIYFLLSIVSIFLINLIKFPTPFIPDSSINSLIIIFVLGIVDAFCMVIPGISGTAIFMMLNCYYFIMSLFSNLFSEILYASVFGIGVLVGIIISGLLMYKLLKKHRDIIYLIIFGFTISSIIILIKPLIILINIFNIIPVLLIWFIGFYFSNKIENIS